MGKKYVLVSNEQRYRLIQLIYNKGYSISMAANATKIYYPTAKAINKVFLRENRTEKKKIRQATNGKFKQVPNPELDVSS